MADIGKVRDLHIGSSSYLGTTEKVYKIYLDSLSSSRVEHDQTDEESDEENEIPEDSLIESMKRTNIDESVADKPQERLPTEKDFPYKPSGSGNPYERKKDPKKIKPIMLPLTAKEEHFPVFWRAHLNTAIEINGEHIEPRGNGSVYEVNHDGITYSIFFVRSLPKLSKHYDTLCYEFSLLKSIRQANIVSITGFQIIGSTLYYSMDHYEGMSLRQIMKKGKAIPPEDCLKFSIDIINGLDYLHSDPFSIEHGELRPENILLSHEKAMICNPGLQVYRDIVSRWDRAQCSFHYVAPEFFNLRLAARLKSDIYCFALIVWSMFTGRRPYDDNTRSEISTKKTNGETPDTSELPENIAGILHLCWKMEAAERPTAKEVKLMLKSCLKET